MNHTARATFDPLKWMAALLGAAAVGGAVALQFAPGVAAELPAAVATRVLFVSLPVMLAGLGLLAFAAVRHMNRPGEPVRRATRAGRRVDTARAVEEELFAEEIAEDIVDAPLPPLPPIPSGVIPAKPARPTVAAAPFRGSSGGGGGHVALSTSKYMNAGSQNFRKGTTHETQS